MSMDERHGTTVPARRLEGWTVLHGPRVAELPGAAAECIVVGPGGIVVVASTPASGPFGARRLASTRASVQRAGSVITSLLDARFRALVTVAVCVPDERSPHELYPLIGGTRGVAVVGTHELPGILHALPARLTAGDVRLVTDGLVRALVARPDGPLLSTVDLPRRMQTAARRERAAAARAGAAATTTAAAPLPTTGTAPAEPGTPTLPFPSLSAPTAGIPTPAPSPEAAGGPAGAPRGPLRRLLAPLRRAVATRTTAAVAVVVVAGLGVLGATELGGTPSGAGTPGTVVTGTVLPVTTGD